MFEIKAIQAEHGDALLVTYGEPNEPRHLLIDGGPGGTRANLVKVLEDSKKGDRLRLEVLIVTHYDLDHIQGIIELLTDKPQWLEIDDIWFNGHRHLHSPDRLGSRDGDALSTLIQNGRYRWNGAFNGSAIRQDSPPVILPGDLCVYVVSPDSDGLTDLASEWTDPNVVPGVASPPGDLLGRGDPWPPLAFSAQLSKDRFEADTSVPNGSSIALVLSCGGRRLLLAADAYASVVSAGMALHFPAGTDIHLMKVSHHGSKANTDRTLLNLLQCRRFLISSSGKIHKHPDNLLIARLLEADNHPDLIFNYAVEHTTRWRDELPMSWPRFNAIYPDNENSFVRIDV